MGSLILYIKQSTRVLNTARLWPCRKKMYPEPLLSTPLCSSPEAPMAAWEKCGRPTQVDGETWLCMHVMVYDESLSLCLSISIYIYNIELHFIVILELQQDKSKWPTTLKFGIFKGVLLHPCSSHRTMTGTWLAGGAWLVTNVATIKDQFWHFFSHQPYLNYKKQIETN